MVGALLQGRAVFQGGLKTGFDCFCKIITEKIRFCLCNSKFEISQNLGRFVFKIVVNKIALLLKQFLYSIAKQVAAIGLSITINGNNSENRTNSKCSEGYEDLLEKKILKNLLEKSLIEEKIQKEVEFFVV